MPFADRYAHWQQRADDPILDYAPVELFQDVAPLDVAEPAALADLTEDAAAHLQQAMHARWEARARAISIENAAQRVEDDNIWPSL